MQENSVNRPSQISSTNVQHHVSVEKFNMIVSAQVKHLYDAVVLSSKFYCIVIQKYYCYSILLLSSMKIKNSTVKKLNCFSFVQLWGSYCLNSICSIYLLAMGRFWLNSCPAVCPLNPTKRPVWFCAVCVCCACLCTFSQHS